jgi:AAA domain
MDKQQGFPRALLKQSIAERNRYFRSYTVAHPNLKLANEDLAAAIREAIPGSLIFVFGPSGVGKTTLRLRTEQRITSELLTELDSDPSRLPVVGIEAISPDVGNFNWKQFYKFVLEALDEPCIKHKVKLPLDDENEVLKQRLHAPRDLRHATERAIEFRKPVSLLVDEAQHLAKVSSGRKLKDELDSIKSLANRTKIPIVLLGTYELLPFRNLSAQLSRRSVDVHFQRYRANHTEEAKSFRNVLWSFQNHLPVHETPDLVGDWDYFYERSIGCVGIVKDWLVRALFKALKDDGSCLTRKQIEKSALSVSQVEKMLSEAIEGESLLQDSPESRSRLRTLMGLPTTLTKSISGENGDSKKIALTEPTSRKQRKPGERKPKRDPIGNGQRSTV